MIVSLLHEILMQTFNIDCLTLKRLLNGKTHHYIFHSAFPASVYTKHTRIHMNISGVKTCSYLPFSWRSLHEICCQFICRWYQQGPGWTVTLHQRCRHEVFSGKHTQSLKHLSPWHRLFTWERVCHLKQRRCFLAFC